MANPASFTINELSRNSSIAQPAVQTVDTTGTVNCPAAGKTSRLIFELINAAAAKIDVTFKAGTSGAAIQSKDLKITLDETGGTMPKAIVGPFESSQFMKADGSIDVLFTPASGSPNVTVRAYRLPKA